MQLLLDLSHRPFQIHIPERGLLLAMTSAGERWSAVHTQAQSRHRCRPTGAWAGDPHTSAPPLSSLWGVGLSTRFCWSLKGFFPMVHLLPGLGKAQWLNMVQSGYPGAFTDPQHFRKVLL